MVQVHMPHSMNKLIGPELLLLLLLLLQVHICRLNVMVYRHNTQKTKKMMMMPQIEIMEVMRMTEIND